MKVNLMVQSAGKAAGQELPITTAQFVIGRDPECNLRPASAMISKRHCAVLVKGGQVTLRDFDSTNGTFLNDQPVKGEVPVKDGDILKVGPLLFKLVIERKAEVNKPTPPPKPRTAASTDEDAAAALLALDEDSGGVTITNSKETADDQIPGGSTVMDMPVFKPGEEGKKEGEEAKPEDKKAANKAKASSGAAQDAARAILEKLKSGKRKA
jgi:pSer/pThr/pTyr-binding forkhead associated (FHA) protein